MDNNIKELWTSIVRIAVKQARQITNDQDALTLKPLYKQWEKQIGRQLEVGEYLQHEDKLYKVLQQHTVQENWMPGVGTESLYMVIDKEHEGTLGDPIPWNKNMECFEGKYYIEDDILYQCTRNSEIALHHKIKDLVGNYFEVYVEDEKEENSEENLPNDNEIEQPEEEELPNDNEDIPSESETENPEEEILPETPEKPEIEILEGTLENPIDVVNMELPINYELDKYYKEGEVVYKCTRTETLHFYPSALVGHYFEIV